MMPVNGCKGCGIITVEGIASLGSTTSWYPCDDCIASGAWVKTSAGGWARAKGA